MSNRPASRGDRGIGLAPTVIHRPTSKQAATKPQLAAFERSEDELSPPVITTNQRMPNSPTAPGNDQSISLNYPVISPSTTTNNPYSSSFQARPPSQHHTRYPSTSSLPPPTLRPNSSANSNSRLSTTLQQQQQQAPHTSVPLHALRRPTQVHSPHLHTPSPNAMQMTRTTSEESLSSQHSSSYPTHATSPMTISEYGHLRDEDDDQRSHTSSASSLTSNQSLTQLPQATTSPQRTRKGSITPTPISELTSSKSTYLPPASISSTSSSSPRKRPTTSDVSFSATATTPLTTVPMHYHVPPPKTASNISPLSNRYTSGRYQQPTRPGTTTAIDRQSSSSSSVTSGGGAKSIYDLSPPSRSGMKTSLSNSNMKQQPIRAAHNLTASSSSTNMMTQQQQQQQESQHNMSLARSSSGFASGPTASQNGALFNIWSRDTSANRGSSTGRGPSSSSSSSKHHYQQQQHMNGTAQKSIAAATASGAMARPSSSRDAHRPVTARANLLSARDDSQSERELQNPYTATYADYNSQPIRSGNQHMKRGSSKNHVDDSNQRINTATMNSNGARARSAHVLCRPPSRQKPPNESLHLGGGHAESSESLTIRDEFPIPSASATAMASARYLSTQRHGWNQTSSHESVAGSSTHALNPVVDLFPAAPIELVRAVKTAQKRIQTADPASGRRRGSHHSSLQQQQHRAISPLNPLITAAMNHAATGGSSDWDTEDGDTEDTASIETDPDLDSTSIGTDHESQVNSLSPHSQTNTDETYSGTNSLVLRSDDTNFGFNTSASSSSLHESNSLSSIPPNFVSLHNILQLQSETTARTKSRSGSATKQRKGSASKQRS